MSNETVGRPMEILLVEDSLTSARLTMGVLKKGDVQHRLTWITNGEEALEFLYQNGKFNRAPRPDLILLDLGLPKKDGREVLRDIKADENLKSIPVVILTASTNPDDIEASEQLEVEKYLTKPVDLEKFLWLVRELKDYWMAGVILPNIE
ncbi:MAG: response regulator [Planctomycetaceae bacterium]|nr:response regulator [Planctomycetaceae bacterium]